MPTEMEYLTVCHVLLFRRIERYSGHESVAFEVPTEDFGMLGGGFALVDVDCALESKNCFLLEHICGILESFAPFEMRASIWDNSVVCTGGDVDLFSMFNSLHFARDLILQIRKRT